MNERDIKEMIEKGYEPANEGYQPAFINPNLPKVTGGYQPTVSEQQPSTPKPPPTEK